jgi:hypothetical protein
MVKGGLSMIELKNDVLVFSFPELHPKAELKIDFQRTLRIPDDGKAYPLPPGLGRFPIQHVDDYANNVPSAWIGHGGVMLPMYQSEALWLNFNSKYIQNHKTAYPFAIKVAAGKINAATGDSWSDWLQRNPQDYMVSTEQPWLDGYCVEKGVIRQFVAMPLGAGYSAEEQLTDEAEFGGIQIVVYPMKKEIFERRFPKHLEQEVRDMNVRFSLQLDMLSSPDMSLAPGGRMKQEIYEDPFDLDDWDMINKSRCFVHIANSLVWRGITGDNPPTVPFTSKEYTKQGLPWFEYYNDNSDILQGSEKLNSLKSIADMGREKGDSPLPENDSVAPKNIVKLRNGLKRDQVREGSF